MFALVFYIDFDITIEKNRLSNALKISRFWLSKIYYVRYGMIKYYVI